MASNVIELIGFAFLAAAARTAFGLGAMELTLGLECVAVGLALDGATLPKLRRKR